MGMEALERERESFRLEGLQSTTKNASEQFQEDGFLGLDLIENARAQYHARDKLGPKDILRMAASNFYLKDGRILAEYRQPFGSAAVVKRL